jgi:radical S-adenosyl methionine domain-containing protein 2
MDWKTIIDNVRRYTPISRFNLAGGEPLLHPHLNEIIQYISDLGIECSIITNGYCLSEDKIRAFQGKISMLGISVDSVEPETLRKMGRCTKNGMVLNRERCIKLCKSIKSAGIKLKINTLVSIYNKDEDFSGFMREISPDRWKILKMKYYNDTRFTNENVVPTNFEYEAFLNRHKDIHFVAERKMGNAYFMVDASGNLIDTGTDNNTSIGSLLQNDFSTVLKYMNFDYETYNLRYAS